MFEKIKKELKFSWEAYKIVCLNIPNIGKKDAKPITRIPWIDSATASAPEEVKEESKDEEKIDTSPVTPEKEEVQEQKTENTLFKAFEDEKSEEVQEVVLDPERFPKFSIVDDPPKDLSSVETKEAAKEEVKSEETKEEVKSEETKEAAKEETKKETSPPPKGRGRKKNKK